ncbi:MAG: hypothetical protein QM696_00280 [Steroidobacteraceae bacterium]
MDTSMPDSPEIGIFSDDLAREDHLGSVVRAHIHIESALNSIVEKLTPSPEHLKRLNLDYDQTVGLALALGLDASWGPALKAIGSLRNRFAHQIDAALDEATVNNLYESLPSMGKNNVQATFTGLKATIHLRPPVDRFAAMDPKGRFQLVAVSIWSWLRAWLKRRLATNGA